MNVRPNEITPVFVNRGEIWQANLHGSIGSEIKHERPVVVVSANEIGMLPLAIVCPITAWKDDFANNVWHVRLEPDVTNGLTKPSAVDALQLRSLSTDSRRFLWKRGEVASQETMALISMAIAAVTQ